MLDLLEQQKRAGDIYQPLRELVIDTDTKIEDIAWSGLLKRTTEKAIYMKRGLRSGERNTDLTNTLLNRT